MSSRVYDPSKSPSLPPHSEEAEEGVLACCLLSPTESIGKCVESLKAGPDCFYDIRNRDIYSALLAMYEARQPVDIITLQQKLKADGSLDACGGMARLAEIPDRVPSAANLSYYLDILREKHVLRSVIATCTTTITHASQCEGGVEELVSGLEQSVMAIGAYRVSSEAEDHDGKSVAIASFAAINERIRGNVDALRTGWSNFDGITKGGLKPSRYYVIAGRPGTGKTAVLVSLLMSVCRTTGASVGLIELEMDAAELGDRMLSVESEIDVTAFHQQNHPSDEQNKKMTAAARRIKAMKLAISDRPNSSVAAIAAKARRWVVSKKIQVLGIDYLQLVESHKGKDRREQVDHISRSIKLLAKELKIPIIVLAQLNREFDKEKKRKPRLSDLRESGSIEQDADFVGMLYDPSEKEEDDKRDQLSPVTINMLVAKQRGGIAGIDLKFKFRPWLTRFDPESPIL